ncbi:hypothetical protein EGT81_19265 [Alcaligenes faecalis]|uniref:hypothetical protein n=1 Tax=Alcaligenes faecalis TaxID=511 RepID=UPI000F66FB99|nr:hypothetical protein [Alcaligenes faecalis]RSE57579.1 hypothetical protein EGT81_19265 [Alcaligenes faecalis]
MSNATQFSFPIHNDELEPTPEVLVDYSLLQAAINRLKKYEPDDEVTLNLEALMGQRNDNPIQVVVELRDLVVERIASNTAIQLIVLDDDVEGADENDCAIRPDLDGKLDEFYASAIHTAEVLPEQVTKIFDAVLAEGEK